MSNILTTSEAARVLQVSAETIRIWADAGKVPCVRTDNGFRVFRREDIERVNAERRELAATA
jgi:excisionase family DNA binding protein